MPKQPEFTSAEKERMEQQHAECRARWDRLRQRGVTEITQHGIEAHFPPPVIDWRTNAPKR